MNMDIGWGKNKSHRQTFSGCEVCDEHGSNLKKSAEITQKWHETFETHY